MKWTRQVAVLMASALVLCLYLTVFIQVFVEDKAQAALPELLIVEIQTASKSSASHELVRIANTTNKNLSLGGVRLEYFSANPKNISVPSRTINLTGSIAVGKTFLLTSKGYLADKSDQQYSATLAAAGGHIRLSGGVVTNPKVYDFVGWGTAQRASGKPAKAPVAGEILSRKKDTLGRYVYTDNNLNDFQLPPKPAATSQTSGSKSSASRVKPTTKSSTNKASSASASTDFTGLTVTELMPNPAKPLMDDTSEYIEIYSSAKRKISLAGLRILAGAKLNKSFVFKSGEINPGQYKAVYITTSKLTLSNSGGRVELRDARGKLVGRSVAYSKAKDGLSYSWVGDGWQWSGTPTPGSKNVMSETTKNKDSNRTNNDSGEFNGDYGQVKAASTNGKPVEKPDSRPVNSKIIAGVGSLGLIYGLYEYRTDIANLYQRIRRNRESR